MMDGIMNMGVNHGYSCQRCNHFHEELAKARVEIERLERECSRLKAVANHESRNVEALMAERGDKADPLTRIAAALERPSREWVAALALASDMRAKGASESKYAAHWALVAADALLAEMGEG